MGSKKPLSVLVVIHTTDFQVLLLERSSHPGFWQSVTGSQEGNESLRETAVRELWEETGLDVAAGKLLAWNLSNRFEIFAEWRHRYPAGVSHNEEHVFSFELPAVPLVRIAPDEHLAYRWLPWREAADAVFSWTNRDALLLLGMHHGFPVDRIGVSRGESPQSSDGDSPRSQKN